MGHKECEETLCLSGPLGISRPSVIWGQLRAAPRDEAEALQPVQSSRPPRGQGQSRGAAKPLGREDPLEKDMATHSSTLDWEISWTEEPGGADHGVAKSQA